MRVDRFRTSVVTSGRSSNSPFSVPVTLNVTTPIPPLVPTLHLSSTGLTFTATVGGTVMPQSVQVTTSDGSAVTFTASAATTSGGTGSPSALPQARPGFGDGISHSSVRVGSGNLPGHRNIQLDGSLERSALWSLTGKRAAVIGCYWTAAAQ